MEAMWGNQNKSHAFCLHMPRQIFLFTDSALGSENTARGLWLQIQTFQWRGAFDYLFRTSRGSANLHKTMQTVHAVSKCKYVLFWFALSSSKKWCFCCYLWIWQVLHWEQLETYCQAEVLYQKSCVGGRGYSCKRATCFPSAKPFWQCHSWTKAWMICLTAESTWSGNAFIYLLVRNNDICFKATKTALCCVLE